MFQFTFNTDWNISTDSGTGYPAITYIDSTNNLTYNSNNLMLEESCRRIYPVIRDANNVMLGGWNIQNSSGTLNFNNNSSNELSLSSGVNLSLNDTLPSIGQHSDVSISRLTNIQI